LSVCELACLLSFLHLHLFSAADPTHLPFLFLIWIVFFPYCNFSVFSF
jgi:hypothetical protein